MRSTRSTVVARRLQIVRARLHRHDDEVGVPDHFRDRVENGGRRIDDEECHVEGAHARDVGGKLGRARARQERRFGLVLVPPFRKAALRVGIDERDRAWNPALLRGNGEMARQGRLAGPAFLREVIAMTRMGAPRLDTARSRYRRRRWAATRFAEN